MKGYISELAPKPVNQVEERPQTSGSGGTEDDDSPESTENGKDEKNNDTEACRQCKMHRLGIYFFPIHKSHPFI